MKKSMTHRSTVKNNKTGQTAKVILRETTHCWVGLGGKRYLKTTGLPPGLYVSGKDLVLTTLLVDSVKRLEPTP